MIYPTPFKQVLNGHGDSEENNYFKISFFSLLAGFKL